MSVEELIKTIPTTRYQGSKRKILPWLYECMKGYDFHTVLDAFGGSGMVSCLLKRMEKRVLAGDGYVASEERDLSTMLDMTNTLQSSRLSILSTVISTKRSAWRDLMRSLDYARDDNPPRDQAFPSRHLDQVEHVERSALPLGTSKKSLGYKHL